MPPEIARFSLIVNVVEAGSGPLPTTRLKITCLKFDPLDVLDCNGQPTGVVTVGAAFTSRTAIMTSFACTPAGVGITTLLPTLLAPVEAERNAIPPPPPPPVTVHVNVSVAPVVAPLSSLTVIEVEYGLLAAA